MKDRAAFVDPIDDDEDDKKDPRNYLLGIWAFTLVIMVLTIIQAIMQFVFVMKIMNVR